MLTEDSEPDVPDFLEEVAGMEADEVSLWPEPPEFETLAEPSWETGAPDNVDAISLYLQEIGHNPLLTAEEEVSLGLKVQQGDSTARNRLVEDIHDPW